MKTSFTIFYSWQSDTGNNRNVINECLEKSTKTIVSDKKSTKLVKIEVDRDTKNSAGSPDISSTVFNKILQSDIFVCDVTTINSESDSKFKKTPNPNVLIELGFAIYHLGWERIILVKNIKYGPISDLPFDIRHRRVTVYNSDELEYKKRLTSSLKIAIDKIIVDYDRIIKDSEKSGSKLHDLSIFDKMTSIGDEEHLKSTLEIAANYLYTTEAYYDSWDKLIEFQENSLNKFLIDELNQYYSNFVQKLITFHHKCVLNFDRNLDMTNANSGIIYSANQREQETYKEFSNRSEILREELTSISVEALKEYRTFLKHIQLHLLSKIFSDSDRV